MSSLSLRIAEFSANLDFDEIPDEVLERVKLHLLDTLGVGLLGRSASPSIAVRKVVERYGGVGESTILGESAVKAPAPIAALVNGTYCHSFDFDDVHALSVLHPGAPVIPGILAVAESVDASGRELLTALTIGYETVLRLGVAQFDPTTRNSVFFEDGFHATSILGAVAAAVGCARLRGLSVEQTADALAIACSMGAGILEANRSGGTVKPVHCGWSAHSGVLASDLAMSGVTGPRTVLEGGFGFFPAFCRDRWSREPLENIGSGEWEIDSLGIKPYPCNGFTHAIVDAAIELRGTGLNPSEIAGIEIGTAAPSWRTIGDPIEEKRNPRSPYHAAFSAPFVFAVSFLGGGGLGLGLGDVTQERLDDPETRRLMALCDVVVDEECTRLFPSYSSAVVRVVLNNGETRESRIRAARGTRDNPLSRDEVLLKLRDTAGSRADSLAAVVDELESADTVGALLV